MQDKVLQINNLSVSYNGLEVFNDLDLLINHNQLVVVIGESGCGKSTLINAVVGFIEYRGRIVKPEKISLVFQDHCLYPWLNVKQNIALGRLTNNKSGKLKADQNMINIYLEIVGLYDYQNKYPHELSGGQRQRVAIARAFISQPDLVLMDEPFNSLDVYTREKMQAWLLDFWQANKTTILFVTHDIEEALFLGDRIVSLSDKHFLKRIDVPFKRPRDGEIKYSEEFVELRREVKKMI